MYFIFKIQYSILSTKYYLVFCILKEFRNHKVFSILYFERLYILYFQWVFKILSQNTSVCEYISDIGNPWAGFDL